MIQQGISMKKILFILTETCCMALFFLTTLAAQPAVQKKIRVLIITGGHGFEHGPFYDLFNSFQNIKYDTLVQPQANALIASPDVDNYDVLVFYDLIDSLSSTQQQAYINLLNRGKAMIFLHHSLVSYQNWPEFIKIVGGQYHTNPVVVNGDTLRANYEHGVTIPVKVENKQHPITKGIDDFEIEDEIYGDSEILPSVMPLLSTTYPKSMRYLAWINHYGHSEVIYIQPGHGPSAFTHPVYRKLVQQAIEWSAEKHK
jgi:uncharacterized protein